MLKRILTVLIVTLGFASGAHAQITVSANGVSNLVLSATGGVLAQGDLVRLGFFSIPSVLGTDNSFSDLNSDFTAIGEGLANSGTLSQSNNSGNTMDINNFSSSGTFLGSYQGVLGTYLPTGSQLYMWVFNSPTASSATQWGIFDAPSWLFPSDPGQVTMSLGSANISVLRGSTNGSNFELAPIPVPEPGTLPFLAGALALGALVWRKTRR